MLVRKLPQVKTVEWGNGVSRRFLLKEDRVGYSLTDTIVWAGTSSCLQYVDHVEACYCIEGSGWVIEADGSAHRLEPGTMYALDEHDPHTLIADEGVDLRLVCVFQPALEGHECHNLSPNGFSSYAGDGVIDTAAQGVAA